MEITEVKVFPINEEKLKAFVSIVFDGCFMVNDIKVIRGREGLFISMPSRKKKNGEFKDVAHPLNNETRQMIEGQVLGEYERVLADRGEQADPPAPRVSQAFPPSATGAGSIPVPPVGPLPGRQVGVPAPMGAGGHESGQGAQRAQSGQSAQGGQSGNGAIGAPGSDEEEKTLKEVEEIHLRDSFWSMG